MPWEKQIDKDEVLKKVLLASMLGSVVLVRSRSDPVLLNDIVAGGLRSPE